MYQNDHLLRRFSESFKLKILAELSTGKYSKRELSRLYGVASSTINDWVRKYDRMDLMNTRVIVETKDEISRLRELQKEIEQLKKLLLKKDIEQLMNDSFMEIAAKKLGYKSVQEFKKKQTPVFNKLYFKGSAVWTSYKRAGSLWLLRYEPGCFL